MCSASNWSWQGGVVHSDSAIQRQEGLLVARLELTSHAHSPNKANILLRCHLFGVCTVLHVLYLRYILLEQQKCRHDFYLAGAGSRSRYDVR